MVDEDTIEKIITVPHELVLQLVVVEDDEERLVAVTVMQVAEQEVWRWLDTLQTEATVSIALADEIAVILVMDTVSTNSHLIEHLL